MTVPNDLAFLYSQRTDLRRMIADCDPDDVSRIGFESRLADIEEELASLEDIPARPAGDGDFAKGRGFYSIVQFCPDAARAEATNVGVVLIDAGTGEMHWRMSLDNARAARVFAGHPALGTLELAKRMLVQRLAARLTGTELSATSLSARFAREANSLQLTEPRRMVFDDVERDLRGLYDELVGDSGR